MKRSRVSHEPCVVPDRLLHRLLPGPDGAMVVAFSHRFFILHMLLIICSTRAVLIVLANIYCLLTNINLKRGGEEK